MPGGQKAIRIECNYHIQNCEREARSLCDGAFQIVSTGDRSCADCGGRDATRARQQRDPTSLAHGRREEEQSSPVYKGVLYVRCGGDESEDVAPSTLPAENEAQVSDEQGAVPNEPPAN
jgi:hypothetical protein